MHDGSCWDEVRTYLQQQGHESWAPTLAGHGEQAGEYFTYTDCIDSVVQYIEQHDINDFVLAGHSFAGIVMPGVAVKLADRITRLVFHNAMILQDGERIYDVLPPVHKQMFDAIVKREGERSSWILPFEAFQENFCNTVDHAKAEEIYAKLKAICVQPQMQPIEMAAFNKLAIPKSFINFTEDIALPPGEYGWYPRMGDRLGEHRLVQRPGDHEACYTCPDVLADALIEAGSA